MNIEEDLFDQMSWQEFETYAIDVLNLIYNGVHELNITRTPDRNDGGKDGYAILHMDSEIISTIDDSLSYTALFWVEVKKRSSTNIGESDIGGNALLALNSFVSKLVFVTNRAFTPRVQDVCKSVGKRLNTSVSFINGKKLLELSKIRPSHQHGNGNREGHGNYLEITSGFVSHIESPLSDSLVSIDLDSQVFWICEIRGFIINAHQSIEINCSNNEEIPLSVNPLTTNQVQINTIDTLHRVVFEVTPKRPGKFHCEDLNAEIISDIEDVIYQSSGSVLHVKHSILADFLPQDRLEVLKKIDGDLNLLKERKGYRGTFFEASAGAGKSYLIQKIRKNFFGLEGREIILDGALHNTVNSVIKTLITQLFPIPIDLTDAVDLQAIRKWNLSNEFREIKQDKALNNLISLIENNGQNLSDPFSIIPSLTLLLNNLSSQKLLLFSFEDLHKVNPSVVDFIRALIANVVAQKQGTIYFLFSSRPKANGRGNVSEWQSAIADLRDYFLEFNWIALKSLKRTDAIYLLQDSVKGMNEFEAETIVDQVGTDPFFLKEALLYLNSIGAIQRNEKVGAYLVDNIRVKEVRESLVLQNATNHRLNAIIQHKGTSFKRILITAACLGKFFDLEVIKKCFPGIEVDLFNELISYAEENNILRFNFLQSHKSNCGFDHDLIRQSVIDYSGGHMLAEVSKVLLKENLEVLDSETQFRLNYLSGDADRCIEKLEDISKTAEKTGNLREGLTYSIVRTAIYLRSGKNFNNTSFLTPYIIQIDEIFNYKGVPELFNKPEGRTLLSSIIAPLEIMTKIGTFHKELSERLISIGMINAESYPAETFKSSLKYYEGHFQFTQGNFDRALSLFESSEKVWPSGKSSRDAFLSQVRIWTSICLRTNGKLQSAKESMGRAIRLRNGLDWNLLIQASANFGAFFMYDNQKLAAKHWRRGLRVSQNDGTLNDVTHFLNDLGHLDIMLGNYDNAKETTLRALAIADDNFFVKESIRSSIFLACIAMVKGELDIASRYLESAEKDAFVQSNLRYLWRIQSNQATIAELKDDLEFAMIKDSQSLQSMPIKNELEKISNSKGSRQSRVSGAIVNIYERYLSNPSLYNELKKTIPREAWDIGSNLHNQLQTSSTKSGIEILHKQIARNLMRFLITE